MIPVMTDAMALKRAPAASVARRRGACHLRRGTQGINNVNSYRVVSRGSD